MNDLKFSHDKLNIEQLQKLAYTPKCKAISVFVGTTKDDFNRQEVVDSSYEAYESIALENLSVICVEIREKWPEVENIVIHHRLGPRPATEVEEASIVVAISSPDQKDAIDATQFCIARVKSIVPIWNKPVIKDEESEWKDNCKTHPPKRKIYHTGKKQRAYFPYTQSNQIQIKLKSEEISYRIQNFINGRSVEMNRNDLKESIDPKKDAEFTPAKMDSPLESGLHHSVSHVSDDSDKNSSYKTQSLDGVEEKLQNRETQPSGSTTPIPKGFYERLKNCEDRLMLLESQCPGYISFWNQTFSNTKKRKRAHSLKAFDLVINNFEKMLDK